MCTQSSYTKYQRKVIKFLNNYLGDKTPFSYERTQNNHLKILVQGISKPIFTGSTPSDRKSIDNIKSYIKRELKLSLDLEQVDPNEIKQDTQLDRQVSQTEASQSKLIQCCIKSLRSRLDMIKSQEHSKVLEQKSLDIIGSHRQSIIKKAISTALQARKQKDYLKTKQMKDVENTLTQHLDFMLPNAAFYSGLLTETELESIREQDQTEVTEMESNPLSSTEKAKNVVGINNGIQEKNAPIESKDIEQESNQIESEIATEKEVTVAKEVEDGNLVTELANMPERDRIQQLQSLSKTNALLLIENIKQAIAKNEQADIEQVLALIQEKDLPIDVIISRLQAA